MPTRKPLKPWPTLGRTLPVRWQRGPLASLTAEGWQAAAIVAAFGWLVVMGVRALG